MDGVDHGSHRKAAAAAAAAASSSSPATAAAAGQETKPITCWTWYEKMLAMQCSYAKTVALILFREGGLLIYQFQTKAQQQQSKDLC